MNPEGSSLGAFPDLTPEPERMDAPIRRVTYLVLRADEHTRQPIDLNYVAIPKDYWEQIVAAVRR